LIHWRLVAAAHKRAAARKTATPWAHSLLDLSLDALSPLPLSPGMQAGRGGACEEGEEGAASAARRRRRGPRRRSDHSQEGGRGGASESCGGGAGKRWKPSLVCFCGLCGAAGSRGLAAQARFTIAGCYAAYCGYAVRVCLAGWRLSPPRLHPYAQPTNLQWCLTDVVSPIVFGAL